MYRAIARLKQRKRTYVAVPVKGGVRKLDTAQIYYVESQDHVLTFHTATPPARCTAGGYPGAGSFQHLAQVVGHGL